jgi:[ribosomal protein S5]-alanine N-acetyltransferase
MKHIDSPRLKYTLFKKQDVTFYKALVMDAEVMRFISGDPLTEEAASTRFEKALALSKLLPGSGYYLANNGDYKIGFCKIQLFQKGELEIGFVVATKFQGKGFASEMVQGMLEYIDANLKNYKVLALVDMNNKGSIHVLEKSGFVYEETKKHNGFISGFYVLPVKS